MIIKVLMPDNTIQEMDVEEYLKAVVPAEMPSSWPFQALMAQAIAARSYALASRNHEGANVCTTSHCQNYNPERIHWRTSLAVDLTADAVLRDNDDKIIKAFYSARCGGHTESKWAPYLKDTLCICSYRTKYKREGHGHGLCQYGAKELAELGFGCEAILWWYYNAQIASASEPEQIMFPDRHPMIMRTVGIQGRIMGAMEKLGEVLETELFGDDLE